MREKWSFCESIPEFSGNKCTNDQFYSTIQLKNKVTQKTSTWKSTQFSNMQILINSLLCTDVPKRAGEKNEILNSRIFTKIHLTEIGFSMMAWEEHSISIWNPMLLG